ncbi:MAG: DUF3288 family protein [Oscillatoriales cyanobacterium RM1_1_9]|nr:DUF3288 family protein [Oscillatoriales cyanobacterium RM2_1_1]NJO71747.1 DUF3288 family protein [Oscillatoriales cyanobacterium RM1_1_9]
MTTQDQQHPQYRGDRATIDSLPAGNPTDYHLAELARLKIRYQGFPGARDIQQDLDQIMQKWQLTEADLYARTREIHAKGQVYRKSAQDQEDWL